MGVHVVGAVGILALVLGTACLGKILGTVFVAKLVGMDTRKSFALGFLMNTKGLVELIVLNIGLQKGVITPLKMLLNALFYHFQVTVFHIGCIQGLIGVLFGGLIIEEDTVINLFYKLQNSVRMLMLLKIPWHGLMFKAALIWITLW